MYPTSLLGYSLSHAIQYLVLILSIYRLSSTPLSSPVFSLSSSTTSALCTYLVHGSYTRTVHCASTLRSIRRVSPNQNLCRIYQWYMRLYLKLIIFSQWLSGRLHKSVLHLLQHLQCCFQITTFRGTRGLENDMPATYCPWRTSHTIISSILMLEFRNMYDSSVSSVLHIFIRYILGHAPVHCELDPDNANIYTRISVDQELRFGSNIFCQWMLSYT